MVPSALTLTPMALHHAPLLGELYHATPNYFALLGSRIPNATEIQNEVEIALQDPRRHLALIHDEQERLVGCLDYKTSYPQPGDLTINLLLIREDHQNQRLGRHAVRLLESRLPAGTQRVLASVLGDNPRGVRFWERLGFSFELDARPALTWYAKHVGQPQRRADLEAASD